VGLMDFYLQLITNSSSCLSPGWMISQRIWEELTPKWPDIFWDDWLREPEQRLGRQILRPEVSRTFHFGVKGGASKNQFGSKLEKIRLANMDVAWETRDVSNLSRDKFRQDYYSLVLDAKLSS